MDRTACTEPQCLYKGDLYISLTRTQQGIKEFTDTHTQDTTALKKGIYRLLIININRSWAGIAQLV